MRLQRPVRTLLALALAGSAWAAEPATAAATAPTPWSIQAPAGAVREQDGAIVMTGRAEEAWSAAQPLAAGPGSDAAPLVVRALLLAGGRRAQAVHPSLLQLGWGDDQAVAVGLPAGDGKERRGWAAWRAGAAHGEALARSQVPAGQPIHLRLVLTSRVIAAETSRDGVAWERLLELPRSGALAGAPTRLAVGRGWGAAAAEGRKGDRSEDSWRFAGVTVQALPSALAADLLKDYRKPDGYDAVRAEDEARGRVLRWRLRGPVPHPARAAGAADAAEDPAGDGWVDAELPPGGAEDQLDVGRLLGAKPNGHYLAAVRIPSPIARWEQLQIEGVREFTVLVDGMPLLRSAPEQRGPVRVAVPLRAGTTTVLVRLTATPGGVALLGMTRADADPRPRIAWLGRIALDFPGEAEAQAEGRREMARLWEGAGHLRAAADVLGELAEVEGLGADEADRAQAERARLLHRLGDAEAVAAVVRALEERWTAAGGGSAARLAAARLWDALGRGDQALAALAAVVADPATPAAERLLLALERVRIAIGQGGPAVAAACTAAAGLLPAGDARRALLEAEGVRRGAAGADPAAPSPEAERLRARLDQDGDPVLVQQLAGQALVVEYRRDERAALFAILGQLFLRHGQGEAARRQLLAAEDLRPADAALAERIARQLASLRSWRGAWARIEVANEVVGRVDAADRACAGDPAAGAAALARLLDERGGNLWPTADHAWRPLRAWIGERLAAGGAPLLEAWRAAEGGRAEAALAAASGAARAQAAARWPFAAPAAGALATLAEEQLDRGWGAQAVDSALQALALPAAAGDAQLALRALQVAVQAGDAAAAAHCAGLLRAHGGTVVRAGKALPAGDAAAATLRLLPAAVPAPADPAPRRAAWVAELPVPPAPLQALALADQPGRAPWLPLTAGGQAFVAGGDGLLAFDLASGALRWRAAGGDGSVPAFAGAPEHRPALAAGVVAARVAVDGRWRLLAWRAGDGRPLWSSAGQAALAGLEAISSPAACGDALVVLASGRERVACLVLDAASGALRGQVELPGERRQPGVGAWGAGILGGHQPAPLIAGGTAYCDTGCGLVAAVAVDACRLRWLAAYPRTVVGEWARPGATALLRRGASTPVLAGGVLAVAPRDSLVVAAFDPVDGRPRWLLDLPDCRRLAAAGGDGLLLQGDALTCLDAASGGTRWRWSRPEAPLLGALAGPGAVLAATAEGLQSLALADGAPGEARAWRELGLDRPATQLVEAGGRLLAAGDGRLALLTGEAGGAARRIAVPAPSVAVQPRAAAVAGDGRGLAVAWFLPAGRIEDMAALPDGCLVRTGDAVLRIDGANGAVRWRTSIPPGSGAVLAAERVVVLDRGWFADLDPATGAVRSSGRLDSDPALVFADDVRCQMQVGDGWLSVSRWGWDQPVLLRRLDDGRTTRVTGMGAPVSAAVIDGRLRVLSSRQGGLWVGDFDPETGAAGKSTRVGNDGWFERWVGWPQRPRWRMAQRGGQVELFDLVAATRSVVAVEGLTGKQIHGLMTWLDGDRLGLFAQDGWASARVGILDPANPAACATRPLPRIEGGRNRLRLANRLLPFGDATVVACERDVPGKGWCSGVACFGPERERWFRPFAGEGRRRPQVMAVLPWGTRLGVVTREGDECLRWHLLAADGAVQDSGLLPAGWFDGSPGVALSLGDRWLLGTGEGLVALAPGSGGLAPVTVPVPAVADTAALAGLAPLAPAGDLPVQVRLGRSEDALLLLVSVPGADAGQGREGLDLGLLPLERNRRGDAAEPARWRVRLADGRTLVERSGPGEALAIRARACSTPAGMRYELSVPWAAIAGEEATRPGALALGLALTSAGRSAELGHGLRAGVAPHAWAVVDWGRK